MKIIGVVGSRRRDSQEDYGKLIQVLDSIYTIGDMIVSGGCYKGADRMAEQIAKERCIPMLIYDADWEKYGKAAGPLRNDKIAIACDVLIALPAEDRTGGTESTIKCAYQHRKRVVLI